MNVGMSQTGMHLLIFSYDRVCETQMRPMLFASLFLTPGVGHRILDISTLMISITTSLFDESD